MAYLCEFRFHPLRPLADDFMDAVHWLALALRRNGQILGDPLWSWQSGKVRFVAKVPHRDAMDPAHRSHYVQSWLTRLAECCKHTPACEIQTHGEQPSHLSSLDGLASLYINPFEDSVVRSGTDGLGVPLYLLPIDPDDRERLNNWQRQFDWISSLEAAGDLLEYETYRQMADPHSKLSRCGRAWAHLIEESTGLPTFYYLVHHYGDHQFRLCPLCGEEWLMDGELHEGLDAYPYRCGPCRLVSHHAGDTEADPLRSPIGQWSLGGQISPG